MYCDHVMNKLREAELLLNQGTTVGEACRKIGVTEQTYYHWCKGYGGMRIEQAKRLKDLERGNARLKKAGDRVPAPPVDVPCLSRSNKSFIIQITY